MFRMVPRASTRNSVDWMDSFVDKHGKIICLIASDVADHAVREAAQGIPDVDPSFVAQIIVQAALRILVVEAEGPEAA